MGAQQQPQDDEEGLEDAIQWEEGVEEAAENTEIVHSGTGSSLSA